MVGYVDEYLSVQGAVTLKAKFEAAIDKLAVNPERHTRVRYLIGRQFEYRRVLIGKVHRIIFTINQAEGRVEVVRIDLQSNDPRSLDNLP